MSVAATVLGAAVLASLVTLRLPRLFLARLLLPASGAALGASLAQA